MTAASLKDALKALEALVDWERRDRRAMRVDTRPVRDLLGRLGNPERRFRAVHVAGTKGKGSVCALVEAALHRAGHVTGRYASPHIERVNERISLNGQEIADAPLAKFLLDALAARCDAVAASTDGRDASWFDVWTVAAFLCFAAQRVEWAVIECGMGGLRDSTNVLDSEVAVLTNVDLEHTALLGDTCEAIAREKLGILRPCRTLVTGISRHAPLAKVVSDVATARGARVVHVEAAASESLLSTNARIANAVLALLPCAPLDEQTIEDARLPGRQETVLLRRRTLDGPAIPVVLDGAHVASSLSAVLRDCEMNRALRGPCTAVLGMGADKDMEGLLGALRLLRHQGVRVVATTSRQGGPTREAADIARAARRLGLPAVDFEDPVCALRHAIAGASETQESGWVLVTGSLYLVGAVRPHLFDLCHRPPVAMPLAA